jgi:hypothetical protein
LGKIRTLFESCTEYHVLIEGNHVSLKEMESIGPYAQRRGGGGGEKEFSGNSISQAKRYYALCPNKFNAH